MNTNDLQKTLFFSTTPTLPPPWAGDLKRKLGESHYIDSVWQKKKGGGEKGKMIDTLRLILFLDCNLTCPYCCNKQEQFYSQFQYKKFDEIDFSKYKNICVTGGEPFYKKAVLYDTFNKIPSNKNIYLYTNGILITADDEDWVMLNG